MNTLTAAARTVCRAYYQNREPSPGEWSDLADALAAHDRRRFQHERTNYRIQAEARIAHLDRGRTRVLAQLGR